ncbi:hypothetical protein Poly30_16730 [Planctomycetes bacterium Poly30]|uniref:JAB1/MPN/MOV34 metalloenzyme domain-containing protein n=1 Tax=Saltatorellus ferox TaxID=2528018 RepID=A0A518EQ14_9BACT|nr:hypothetical protein Poly30_16730 [Planctomycetes bacterium Poly30]
MKPLRLSAEVCAAIAEESQAAYPREACGLLLGSRGHDRDEATVAARCRNLAAAPKRFEVHPEDFLAAELRAEDEGLIVLGVWHSHPDEPAIPSESDRAGAYSSWCYVIAEARGGSIGSVRAWQLEAGRFEERVLETSAP